MGRLVFLQIIKGDYYKALAIGQQNISTEIIQERGKILFSDGETKLATNHFLSVLYIDSNKIKEKEKISGLLTEIINLKKEFILEKLNKNSGNEILKKELTPEEIKEVKKLNIDGISIKTETNRDYPQEDLASQVSGYVGWDGKGQYGLEEYYEKDLKGQSGFFEGEKDLAGRLLFFGLDKYLEPQNGIDLTLTIDYNIQFFAEKLLKQAKENLNMEQGTIIVLEPNTGKIFALANYPGFDPNNYSSYKDFSIFQNSAIQELYEPGSILKPITMASAINDGKITPDTTYKDEGFVKIGNYTISNFANKIYGEKTMTQVLENSINTGAVFAEEQLGDEPFLKYLKDFGLFEKTKIDLAGEVYYDNENLKEGKKINFATASFGQGITTTPMQIVRAFSVIANGGKIISPYIVDKKNKGGNVFLNQNAQIQGKQVISPSTSSSVTAMMVSVLENGYSKKARIPGYYIAGKTGTAQVPWTSLGINKAGYSDKTIQSFIGFAPAFSPRFLILVKLNNPEANTAEYSAMPIFRELAKYVLDYLQIPPDYQK